MSEGIKYDKDKVDYSLVPVEALEAVAKVMTHGAKKYSRENWKHVDDFDNRYLAAAMRHIAEWRKGYQYDTDSGERHLAHAICCLMFLMEGKSE